MMKKQATMLNFFSKGIGSQFQSSNQAKLQSNTIPVVESDSLDCTKMIQPENVKPQNPSETIATVSPPTACDSTTEVVCSNSDLRSHNGVRSKLDCEMGVKSLKQTPLDSEQLTDSSSSSELEKIRLENIQRNEKFLNSLGLDTSTLQNLSKPASLSGKPVSLKRKCFVETVSSQPTRRSARITGHSLESSRGKEKSFQDEAADWDSEVDIEDSVGDFDANDGLRYVLMNTLNEKERPGFHDHGDQMKGLCLLNSECIECPDLPAIYSMQFHPCLPSLLLAAGKGGVVALFNINGNGASPQGQEPGSVITSFKAHDRWVSGAKFIEMEMQASCTSAWDRITGGAGVGVGPMMVLTASDDATVKLWDLSKVRRSDASVDETAASFSSMRQKPLLLSTNKSIHSKGIFAMDVSHRGGKVLTGSKDRRVCFSRLVGERGAVCVERSFEMHAGVVKAVAWQEAHGSWTDVTTFASGSQDRSVCVKVRICNKASLSVWVDSGP